MHDSLLYVVRLVFFYAQFNDSKFKIRNLSDDLIHLDEIEDDPEKWCESCKCLT